MTDGSGPRGRAKAKTRPGGRPSPSPTQGSSHRGPSGERRAGRRATVRPPVVRPSFLERYRGAIIGGAVVAVLAVVAAFLLFGATQPAYACESLVTPAPSATPGPAGAPAPLGQPEQDMGRRHIEQGASARYATCPPASGPHYNAPGGPIQPRFYGKDDTTVPQGWIHNLEHGGFVLLYRCGATDTCDAAQQQQLQQFAASFPASPVCNLPAGRTSPVVTRFDQMSTPYTAVIWGRILPLQTLDTAAALRFYAEQGERTNPEPQCAAPGASPTAPSASPGAPSPGTPSPASPAPSGASPEPSAASPSPS